MPNLLRPPFKTAPDASPQVHTVSPSSFEALTARETQVLKLIADGKSTKEIAEILGITFKTAASHRSRILWKFGVHESITAVRAAIRAGIIEPILWHETSGSRVSECCF